MRLFCLSYILAEIPEVQKGKMIATSPKQDWITYFETGLWPLVYYPTQIINEMCLKVLEIREHGIISEELPVYCAFGNEPTSL